MVTPNFTTTEAARDYYLRMLADIMDDADVLATSTPISPMTGKMMEEGKARCMARIRDLAGFLSNLYASVDAIHMEEKE